MAGGRIRAWDRGEDELHIRSSLGLPAALALVSLAAGTACDEIRPDVTSTETAAGGEVLATAPDREPEPPLLVPVADPVVGDVVPVGRGGSLSVSATEADVNGGRLFNPPRGKDYFAVEAKACAGATEEDLSFEPDFFVLRMDGGGVVVPTLGVKKPDLRGGEIGAGQCMDGWITFAIGDEAAPVSVDYNGSSRLSWRIPEEPPEGSSG